MTAPRQPAPAPAKNPLVREGKGAAATEGAGLFHDATEAVTGFADGNWAEGLLNVASAAGSVGTFLADPLAGLFSAGFGWLMEHVSFLREPLDWLTGDQQTLDGMAQTWSSVSSYLTETATDLGMPMPDNTVLGGVVPVINVEGIKPGEIALDGPTLAKIFLGEIKTWNDPAIPSSTPSAKLPAQPIVVVHRSDGSGTTFIFTDYLSKVSPDWKSKVGANTAVEWPVGIGAKGNEGVANNVGQTKGSIGYVEYAYAKQNKLTYAKMINKDGKTVAPTAEAFQAAAANADWERHAGLRRGPDQRAGRGLVADRGRDLHPDAQAAAGCGGRRRSAQVLRLGLRQGRQDGRGARLRPDAGQGRHRHPEGLGGGDQGRGRQAAVRAVATD